MLHSARANLLYGLVKDRGPAAKPGMPHKGIESLALGRVAVNPALPPDHAPCPPDLVEITGFEPVASALQGRRSPN